eukprot:Nk52_evm1s167 gene=Nk52_evmTU1s167
MEGKYVGNASVGGGDGQKEKLTGVSNNGGSLGEEDITKLYEFDREKGTYVYKSEDGTRYEWSVEKNAWFPSVDEYTIASYQVNYGLHSYVNEDATQKAKEEKQKLLREKDAKKKMGEKSKNGSDWKEVTPENNPNVYVENLPLDITEEEFVEFMKKAGIIKQEEDSEKFKIKLYKDENGTLKGDGLCSYLKPASVELALQILDGTEIRKGFYVKLSRAVFKPKDNYLKKGVKRKPEKGVGGAKKKGQKRLLGWAEESGTLSKRKRAVVIMQNLFEPKEFVEDPKSLDEIKEDVEEECSRFGIVKKCFVFDKNEKGVVSVQYETVEGAERCIKVMNGRFFGGRKVEAFHWDGKTRYSNDEDEKLKEKRLGEWEKWLEETEQE